MLPRPNDIGIPLEVSSILWDIFDNFDVSKAEWHPYYKDGMQPFENLPEKTVVSYYAHEDGRKLVFIANQDTNAKTAKVSSGLFKNATVYDAYNKEDIAQTNDTVQFSLEKYECKILLVK